MNNGIKYKINPPVTNLEVNTLFEDTWFESHEDRDFVPVLEKSLAYICAYQNAVLVGFVNIAWDSGLHTFLLVTTVCTDLHRQGIGQELVHKAMEVAQSKCAEWFHVDYEPQYVEFYKNCGFRDIEAGLINLKEK